MDAEQTSDTKIKPLEATDQSSAPSTYPVAREAPGIDNLNTIDILGERAFSV
jgi:hypothetical protein